MNGNETILIEILKVAISLLTPLFVLFIGIRINKSLEKSKKALLQEKEWQVRWAETFLVKAIKFEENISMLLAYLCQLPNYLGNDPEAKQRKDNLLQTIHDCSIAITYLDWDIRNFAQFAEANSKSLIEKQSELFEAVKVLYQNKQGDLEKIRKIQFEYNQLVRKAHNEILTKESS